MVIEREKESAQLLGEKETDVFRSVCVVLLATCLPLISSSICLTIM